MFKHDWVCYFKDEAEFNMIDKRLANLGVNWSHRDERVQWFNRLKNLGCANSYEQLTHSWSAEFIEELQPIELTPEYIMSKSFVSFFTNPPKTTHTITLGGNI